MGSIGEEKRAWHDEGGMSHKRKLGLFLISLTLILGSLTYMGIVVTHVPPLDLKPAINTSVPVTTQAVPLSWPTYGQAAVGASHFGVLATHGRQTPVPTASTAKILMALAVLRAKPLSTGQTTSPDIRITQADVEIYRSFVAQGGSVALVAEGERISEYQALQALLLPSADNIADTLAIWAFGSLQGYITYANRLAAQLGFKDTHLDDPSGLSPATMSTARDLVQISLEAMKDPVFAEIVSQPSAVLPVAGTTRNRNFLLGKHDIIGIKTGNTHEAGGVFVAAAVHHVGGQTFTVVAAVMGGPNLTRSMLDSVPLLAGARQNFVQRTVVKRDTTIGTYNVPWANQVNVKTDKDLKLVVWGGALIASASKVDVLRVAGNAGMPVGSVTATFGGFSDHVQVVTSNAISRPGLWWRMRHPLW